MAFIYQLSNIEHWALVIHFFLLSVILFVYKKIIIRNENSANPNKLMLTKCLIAGFVFIITLSLVVILLIY